MWITVIGVPLSYLAEMSATEPMTTRSVLTWVKLCNFVLGEARLAEELADKANARTGNQKERIVLLMRATPSLTELN
jgi:hypothetical protein